MRIHVIDMIIHYIFHRSKAVGSVATLSVVAILRARTAFVDYGLDED